MRFALVGVNRVETLGVFGLVAGLLIFLSGYVAGAQTQPAATATAACAQATPNPEPTSDSIAPMRRVRTVTFHDEVPQ